MRISLGVKLLKASVLALATTGLTPFAAATTALFDRLNARAWQMFPKFQKNFQKSF
jgi:hypothetical protein